MKTLLTWKRLGQILFVLVTLVLLLIRVDIPGVSGGPAREEYFEGKVISLTIDSPEDQQEEGERIQYLEVFIKDGPSAGSTIEIQNSVTGFINGKEYKAGDDVVLVQYEGEFGLEQLYVMDYVRRPSILILFGLFVLVVLIVNRKKGFYALLSMAFSFLVLFKLVLPMLLQGVDPVLSALLGSLFILPAMFYLSHGFTKKTHVAIISTLIALIITGILATIFTELSQLSGLTSEESTFLKVGIGSNINFTGLTLAGIIISVLGILDDVTITQTSVVQQLKAVQQQISLKELYTRSMAVGRDHIASVVNTLILVYTGASLPLLLIFFDSSHSLSDILNYEFMAEEITRTLVGSIGLILAVPIATVIASVVFHKDEHVEVDHSAHTH